jgi:membrane protease YdiL (CAAX protease family)
MKAATGDAATGPKTRERQEALWALLLLLPAPSLGAAASLLLWPEATAGKALFIVSKLWILLLPLCWLRFVDHQVISWSRPRHGGFGMATASGLLIATAILGVYALALKSGLVDAQAISSRAAKTGLNHPGVYLTGAIYWITLNSLMEEYVWRWFVFRKFEAVAPGRIAVVAASLGFTAHHVIALAAQFNWLVTLLGSVGVFIGGAAWSWLYLRYRSVWPCYLSHAIVDAPIFWIGYDLIFLRGN